MLQTLRNLKSETKKKVVFAVASTLTFFVFVFWVIGFSGVFLNTWNDTATKGASAYKAFEQNVEKVYNTMNSMIPKGVLDSTNENTEIPHEVSTTTNSM